tara:strand:- start:196 stop:351 length:156 start_codon:yes stop_codon:yes gene_type:complete
MPDYLNYNFWNPEDKRKDRQEYVSLSQTKDGKGVIGGTPLKEKINDTLSKK